MSSEVQFEEDSFRYGKPGSSGGNAPAPVPGVPVEARNEPKMVQWLIRHNLAKSAAGAQGILVAVIVVDFIITYFIIKFLL